MEMKKMNQNSVQEIHNEMMHFLELLVGKDQKAHSNQDDDVVWTPARDGELDP